jgi:hypothetical protein
MPFVILPGCCPSLAVIPLGTLLGCCPSQAVTPLAILVQHFATLLRRVAVMPTVLLVIRLDRVIIPSSSCCCPFFRLPALRSSCSCPSAFCRVRSCRPLRLDDSQTAVAR